MFWLFVCGASYISIVILFHVYIRFYANQGNFCQDSVPVVIEPWYFPFFGPVLSMTDLKSSLKRWKEKYGENFTIRILGKYLTMITKPADLKRFYHAGEETLSLVKAATVTIGNIYPESQYVVEYNAIPYLSLLLTSENLRVMLINMENTLKDYFDPTTGSFWSENGTSVVVDIFPFVYRLITRINCLNFTSNRVYKNHVDELIELFSTLDTERNITNPVGENLKKFFGLTNDRKGSWKRWLEILNFDTERSLRMIENGVEPSELDSIFMAVRYAKEELEKRGEKFTIRLVGFLVYSSFLPAQLNTYATAAFALLEWCKHRDDEIGEQIQREIEQFSINSDITLENLNKMEFISAYINEIIRVRTNSQLAVRVADNDFQLSDGKKVAKGNLVATQWGNNQDMFEAPTQFDPWRHLPPREEQKRDPYRFLPFGKGKHPCTGERYVKLQIKLILIYFSRFCEWSIEDRSRDYESLINQNLLAGINRPTKSIFVRLTRKTPTD